MIVLEANIPLDGASGKSFILKARAGLSGVENPPLYWLLKGPCNIYQF